jgi:hypothetical protein
LLINFRLDQDEIWSQTLVALLFISHPLAAWFIRGLYCPAGCSSSYNITLVDHLAHGGYTCVE